MSDEAVATGKKQPKARTSITVDRGVYERALKVAEEKGMSFSSLVEATLTAALDVLEATVAEG